MTDSNDVQSSQRPVSVFGGISPRDRGGSAVCNAILRNCNGSAALGRDVILLANEAVPEEGTESVLGLANSFKILQDEWILIPYGDQAIQHNHRTVLQRLTLDVANAMVTRFDSFRGKATRKFSGLPFYVGHPDHPAFANEHKDTKSYGWIMQLDARTEGLAFKVNWSEAGHTLLANAHYKFFSPNWQARIVGKENGTPVAEPVWLKSVGFTNDPNWPVFPLANEQKREGEDDTMNLLQRIIAILGLDDISEDGVILAITKLFETAKKVTEASDARWDAESAARDALPNEIAPGDKVVQLFELLEGKIAALANQSTELTTAQAAVASETTKREEAETSFANARKAHATILIDQGIISGKLLQGDRDSRIEAMVGDFDGQVTLLANAAPLMKVDSDVDALPPGGSRNASKRDQILSLVNEKKSATGLAHHDAYMSVKAENPALFAEEEAEA